MNTFANLSDNQIATATISMPYQGLWHTDLQLIGTVSLNTQVHVNIGDLSLLGTPFRSGDFLGSTKYRIVGGYGGWMKLAQPRSYRSPLGVNASLILGDLANETGEKVSVVTDFSVGQYYIRMAAPAARTLSSIADLWWVREDGVTVIGSRASTIITSPYDVLPESDLGIGRVMIATDNPKDWIPGRTFTPIQFTTKTIKGVTHTLDRDKLRTEVWV